MLCAEQTCDMHAGYNTKTFHKLGAMLTSSASRRMRAPAHILALLICLASLAAGVDGRSSKVHSNLTLDFLDGALLQRAQSQTSSQQGPMSA